MDRKKSFRSIENAVRSLEGLPEAMESAGFDGKEVSMVRYIVSSAGPELAEAVNAENRAVSDAAVVRISDRLSLDRAAVRSLVRDMRETIHGPEKRQEKKTGGNAVQVKNAGNNSFVGGRGFVFRPDPASRTAYFLVKYVGDDAEVSVPETISLGRAEGTVTGIGENAFRRTPAESVMLPDTIISIGAAAFEGCENLRLVRIPSGIEYIGSGAFRGCPKLASIDLGQGCSRYRSDPKGLIYSADGKTLLHVPGAVGGNVEIASGTHKIADSAFWGCGTMESVSIPEGVVSIGVSAFAECSGLRSLELPASLESVGDYAFGQCSSMESISVAPGNGHFRSEGGALYSADGRILLRVPGGFSGSFSVPSHVEAIGRAAFSDCEKLESVSMDSVVSIGDDAFRGCVSLGSAEFGSKLVSLGKYAFMGCSSLKKVFLPDSVEEAGTWLFGECSSLYEASIPGNLEPKMTVFPEAARIVRR